MRVGRAWAGREWKRETKVTTMGVVRNFCIGGGKPYFLPGFRISPARPSGMTNMKMKINENRLECLRRKLTLVVFKNPVRTAQ